MSKYLVSRPGPLLTPVLFLSAHPSATLPAPLQLAYCVVQFLEKDATLTEHVSTSGLCATSLQSCPTLCGPIDCSPPGSSVLGILQARILEWVAVPSSKGSSQPRDQTHVLCVSCITGGFFTTEPPGKPSSTSGGGGNLVSWQATLGASPGRPDSSLPQLPQVIRGLLKYWPKTCTQKEV